MNAQSIQYSNTPISCTFFRWFSARVPTPWFLYSRIGLSLLPMPDCAKSSARNNLAPSLEIWYSLRFQGVEVHDPSVYVLNWRVSMTAVIFSNLSILHFCIDLLECASPSLPIPVATGTLFGKVFAHSLRSSWSVMGWLVTRQQLVGTMSRYRSVYIWANAWIRRRRTHRTTIDLWH